MEIWVYTVGWRKGFEEGRRERFQEGRLAFMQRTLRAMLVARLGRPPTPDEEQAIAPLHARSPPSRAGFHASAIACARAGAGSAGREVSSSSLLQSAAANAGSSAWGGAARSSPCQ